MRYRRGPSVKTRLAALLGALFVVAGAALLVVNYVLVRATLPSGNAGPAEHVPTSTTTTVTVDGSTSGVTALNIGPYRAKVLHTLVMQSGATLGIMLLLAVLLGWYAARRALRPVHDVVSTARRLGADNLHERIRLPGPRDEITELADTFDGMLDRLEASFESQRTFAANASHELRTPLATQRAMAEVAMARPSADDAMRELCRRLLVMNVRSEALIDGLLVLTRSDRGLSGTEPVRLDELVEHVVAGHRLLAEQAGISLHCKVAPRVVPGDRVLLERLVANLVDNALKYNVAGGEVHVQVGDETDLEVSNTGPYVPRDEVSRLVEPFRRLGRDRAGTSQGSGLGLSIVASIARAHGGVLGLDPLPEGGLRARVAFPSGDSLRGTG